MPPTREGSYGLLYGYQHRNLSSFTVDSIPSLIDKTALVTGSNPRIGKWVALRLTQKGAKVYLACRFKARAEDAMKWIREESECTDASWSSLIWADDGLMPAIRKACVEGDGGVRVVMMTSAGFSMHPDKGDLHIEDWEVLLGEDGNGDIWWKGAMPTYGRSKICTVLFARELSRLLRQTDWGKNLRINSCHPGKQSFLRWRSLYADCMAGTVSTSLNNTLREGSWFFLIIESFVYALASIPQGISALALLYAATFTEVRNRDIIGQYMTPYGYVNIAAVKGSAAENDQLAAHLWMRSEKLCSRFVASFEVQLKE